MKALNARQVFINCPFDPAYWPLLEGMVFSVMACGYEPLTALQEANGADLRLQKLYRQIKGAGLAIHDLSWVKLDEPTGLPRFNMPFELGLFVGCREFGGKAQRQKKALVFERNPYEIQKCLSDLAGCDVRPHAGDITKLMSGVRDWLRTVGSAAVPGDRDIRSRFEGFSLALPELCEAGGLDRSALKLVDYLAFAQDWLSDKAS